MRPLPHRIRAGPGLERLEPRLLWSASTPPAALTADLATALDTYWQFEEVGSTTLTDSSGSAAAHPGALTGPAGVSSFGVFGNAGYFDGGEASITNHADFNLSTLGQRTISLWFYAEDVDTPGPQMLYEEGGGTRGLNIYIEDGRLYFGGWNRAESGWLGTWLSTDAVVSNQWHHVTLVLDGDATVQLDSFRGYLDGLQFGSGEGSQLWPHSGDINVGNGADTRYPDGVGSKTDTFHGYLDEFRAYSRVLTDHDIAVLGGAFNERAAIKNTMDWREVHRLGTQPDTETELVVLEEPGTQAGVERTSATTTTTPDTVRVVGQDTYATPGTDGSTSAEANATPDNAAIEPAEARADSVERESSDGSALTRDDASPSDATEPQVAEVETEGKRLAQPKTTASITQAQYSGSTEWYDLTHVAPPELIQAEMLRHGPSRVIDQTQVLQRSSPTAWMIHPR